MGMKIVCRMETWNCFSRARGRSTTRFLSFTNRVTTVRGRISSQVVDIMKNAPARPVSLCQDVNAIPGAGERRERAPLRVSQGMSYPGERTLNFLLAALICLPLLPLMGGIAILIRVADGQPVLYRGRRLGFGGRLFTMYKFRTLKVGSEERIGGRLMREDEQFVTPVGRILRRFKLDELPQLFNVLGGDMNFVGPRPVRAAMAADYASFVPRYGERFAARPGLTGLAQLRGGYYCDPLRKTRYDRFYIRKRSIRLDLILMVLTGLRLVMSPDCLKAGNRPVGARLESQQELGMQPAQTEKSSIAA